MFRTSGIVAKQPIYQVLLPPSIWPLYTSIHPSTKFGIIVSRLFRTLL
jgi:hypothetical protein